MAAVSCVELTQIFPPLLVTKRWKGGGGVRGQTLKIVMFIGPCIILIVE